MFAYLDDFPDAVDTVGEQTLHASVIIHVIGMPDAHEQYVRGKPWDSIGHGAGIHISDEIFYNFVFVFAGKLDHTTHFLRFKLGRKRKQVLEKKKHSCDTSEYTIVVSFFFQTNTRANLFHHHYL